MAERTPPLHDGPGEDAAAGADAQTQRMVTIEEFHRDEEDRMVSRYRIAKNRRAL